MVNKVTFSVKGITITGGCNKINGFYLRFISDEDTMRI